LLRCAVFADLWQQGFFVTRGLTFGGDFLVYAGDPADFHAEFVAVVIPWHQGFRGLDLVGFGRLSSSVRKAVLLCSAPPQRVRSFLRARQTYQLPAVFQSGSVSNTSGSDSTRNSGTDSKKSSKPSGIHPPRMTAPTHPMARPESPVIYFTVEWESELSATPVVHFS